MNHRKRKGDLKSLILIEHIDDPKRYAIAGVFVGSKKEVILARVGEGASDPRTPESIAMLARSVLKTIQNDYSLMAYLRNIQVPASG